jgi:hypothetical protein
VSVIVHHSEVLTGTVDALSVKVAVVTVVGTHLAAEGSIVHHCSWLTDTQTGTHNAQVVPHDAGRTDILVETHRTFSGTVHSHNSTVVVVARQRQTSLDLVEDLSVVR